MRLQRPSPERALPVITAENQLLSMSCAMVAINGPNGVEKLTKIRAENPFLNMSRAVRFCDP